MDVRPVSAARTPKFARVPPKPFQITERDLDVLHAVGTFAALQSIHLDRLFPDASDDKIRRRLKHLFNAGYLTRPRPQIASMLDGGSLSMIYLLTRSGAALLAKRRGVSLMPRPDDLKLSQILHTLEISDFMVATAAACRQSQFLALEPWSEVLARAPSATREQLAPEQWKVAISHRGLSYTFHLKPDAIYTVCHKEAAAAGDPRARKLFFLEQDRATMPIERSTLHQSSVVRKFLSYAQTFRTGIHRDRFGVGNMRDLFVTKNHDRIETMIRAFKTHLTGSVSPRLFLFADRQTLFGEGTPFFDCPWLDGEGKSHTLFE